MCFCHLVCIRRSGRRHIGVLHGSVLRLLTRLPLFQTHSAKFCDFSDSLPGVAEGVVNADVDGSGIGRRFFVGRRVTVDVSLAVSGGVDEAVLGSEETSFRIMELIK